MASSKPPLDFEDTDWGQKVERRHLQNQERFLELENRLDKVEVGQKSIKADTEWLVDVFRGSRAIGKLVGWAIVAASGLITLWAFLHGQAPPK